ncbi:hypothetical protein A4X13_0g7236 [Tilletia indica]|uniref:Uncharacterized protein n=1 Tax=Tilletia indica TaxID=43049 RepID=A0A177T7E2_9BASI|nr:hypothetical protein A4X13_0g7236 [Tilletia indica]
MAVDAASPSAALDDSFSKVGASFDSLTTLINEQTRQMLALLEQVQAQARTSPARPSTLPTISLSTASPSFSHPSSPPPQSAKTTSPASAVQSGSPPSLSTSTSPQAPCSSTTALACDHQPTWQQLLAHDIQTRRSGPSDVLLNLASSSQLSSVVSSPPQSPSPSPLASSCLPPSPADFILPPTSIPSITAPSSSASPSQPPTAIHSLSPTGTPYADILNTLRSRYSASDGTEPALFPSESAASTTSVSTCTRMNSSGDATQQQIMIKEECGPMMAVRVDGSSMDQATPCPCASSRTDSGCTSAKITRRSSVSDASSSPLCSTALVGFKRATSTASTDLALSRVEHAWLMLRKDSLQRASNVGAASAAHGPCGLDQASSPARFGNSIPPCLNSAEVALRRVGTALRHSITSRWCCSISEYTASPHISAASPLETTHSTTRALPVAAAPTLISSPPARPLPTFSTLPGSTSTKDGGCCGLPSADCSGSERSRRCIHHAVPPPRCLSDHSGLVRMLTITLEHLSAALPSRLFRSPSLQQRSPRQTCHP